MKTIALAFASVLLSSTAFAQGVPPLGPLPNPTNVITVVNAVDSANFAAGITRLDVSEVRSIPAFNVPGGNAQRLSGNIATFLIATNPQ